MPISEHQGMGAMPFDGGAAFRVWAPFAESVAVAGDFNNWSESDNQLTKEDNGYWSTDVAGAASGHKYKYFITNGATFWKNDPYAREVATAQDQNGIIQPAAYDWSDDQFNMAPWNELVIYEMHTGTFTFVPESRDKFDDATKRLDYLKDLGINAILVMAAGEFVTDTSLGYNPAYIFAVEESFGGENAFKNFVKAAHVAGIAVILDVVYNHLGPQGLEKSVWRFDGWSENEGGGIYFYQDWRAKTPWVELNRPDYGRPEVRQYLCDSALNWLDSRHVDGLRWDATNYVRNVNGDDDPTFDIAEGWSLMQWINDQVAERWPWKLTIAEDMQSNDWITKDTGEGGAGFGSQWDAAFVHPVRDSLTVPDDRRSMAKLGAAIQHRYNASAFERVIYTESHDEIMNGHARLPEDISPGDAGNWQAKKLSTLGAGIVFTAPGMPMIFQGQEFLEDGWWSDQDPLDWSKATKFSGVLQLYRDLIRLRRNWFNNTRGLHGQNLNLYHVNENDKLLAYHRWDQGGAGDDVVVVLNLANRAYDNYTIGLPCAGEWKVRLNSDWNGYDADFANFSSYGATAEEGAQDNLPYHASLGIGPYTILILSQDE